VRIAKTRHLNRFLIAQPNNLGDVVCCLPVAGAIKQAWPKAQVFFAARSYAKALVSACSHIDGYLDSEHVRSNQHLMRDVHADVFINPCRDQALAASAKRADIPIRIGNLRRLNSVNYCNQFVYFGRDRSGLHEAQLNLKELGALGIKADYSADQINSLYGLTRLRPLSVASSKVLEDPRFKLIFHVKSNGNSREWPIEHFHALAKILPAAQFKIFVTGVAQDGDWIRQHCPQLLALPHVTDMTGRMDLDEFIAFIAAADGLLAASTGPLHIAAALGKYALGVYPPRAGKEPVRWGPFGLHAESITLEKNCVPGPQTCARNALDGGPCACMYKILPSQVADRLLAWLTTPAAAA
jgi:ADP-heptose:LPS heptosyltransferase